MDSYTYAPTKRKKNHRFFKIIFFFLILLILLGSVYSNSQHNRNTKLTTLIKPISTPSPYPSIAPLVAGIEATDSASGLQNAVQGALQGTHGTYGIVVKNVKSGETYAFNQDVQFATASLYKLWVMVVVYQQMQSGMLKENQVLSKDALVLNKEFQIDGDVADQTDGTVTFSVADALHQMITISDNEAALLLTDKIGLSSIAAFLQKYGFSASNVGTNGDAPTSTPSDIALFFEKLYKGHLANEQYTQEMISLLKSQALNSKIPKYLPEDVTSAHKTGELDSYSHDAGIVYSPSADYILVVLTNTDDPDSADERISEVSQNVYNYFN